MNLDTLRRRFLTPDVLALAALIALWLLFFWRLFTPVAADQAALANGDFSGQFVAFAGYQYDRFAQGQVPLWDPYNNGGLPFIADTQAAVFYPPRLATLALSNLTGGFTYHALELEMTFHVLLFTLLMYAFVRRLTLDSKGSVFGAFVAAVIVGYGGFTSGYPPLQLAILEAAVWLPLAALGIHEATRGERLHPLWLLPAGFALGLSWMAGHPQTSWFATYLLVAYLGYRIYSRRWRWTAFASSLVLFGVVTVGITAVQLLPAAEYLSRTARPDLGFDLKANGFPIQDLAQFIFPGIVSVFSPLYVGIAGLALAAIALWRRVPGALFWAAATLIALGLSFGEHSVVFHALYSLLPGLRFFRGQERAAYLVSVSLAVLAGLGAAHIISWDILQDFKATQRIKRALLLLLGFCAAVTILVFALWLGNRDAYDAYIGPVAFSALIAALTLLVLPYLLSHPADTKRLLLVAGVLVFDLFSVNIDNSDYAHNPPSDQLSLTPPPLVARVLADRDGVFRVDGWRGLTDNYGSLYGVMDMRGISPLFLQGPYTLIYRDYVDNPLAWELFSVRYVFSERDTLSVPSDVVGTGADRSGQVYLHKLSNPRPFALLLYSATVLDSDSFAYALLDDPRFNPRQAIILDREPDLPLPDNPPPEGGQATITDFAPEAITIDVDTPANAVLSVSLPDYPGWQATVDNQPATIIRAYGALTAVSVPDGTHTVQLTFAPVSYRVGAILSLLTWGALGILGVVLLLRRIIHAVK